VEYSEAIDWLYATQWHGVKLGLDSMKRLVAACEVDPACLRFIHVAGTNGKGSVCAYTEALLRRAGHRVGRYTSPHLISFTERFQVNGSPIPETVVAEELTRLRELVAKWEPHPTFFELATALALIWFAREAPDWVVWETGLGGRLDATNIVLPEVSVITSIDYDHQAYLGDTLEAIAGEKAGIIKPARPVCTTKQAPQAERVLTERAAVQKAPIRYVDLPEVPYPLSLPGQHQQRNARLAVEAARLVGIELSSAEIGSVLSEVTLPGRFQFLSPTLVADGAHNPSAAQALAAAWRERFGKRKAHLIFGALEDKPIPELLAPLLSITRRITFVPVRLNPRSCSLDQLLQCGRELAGDQSPMEVTDDLPTTFRGALKGKEPTLITGSLFLVAEALALHQQHEIRHPSRQ